MKFIYKRVSKILLVLLTLSILFSAIPVQAKTKKQTYKDYACSVATKKYHWSKTDCKNLIKLWNKESGWNPKDKYNGCYGIPQRNLRYTSAKEKKKFKSDWKYQIDWGLKYIKKRYKNPTRAWNFWKKHHWY